MIILCYDGSTAAKHAITTAHSIVGQAPAVVLHVWEPPATLLGPDPFGGVETWTGPQMVELEAMALERAKRAVEYGVELAHNAGFTAEGRLERATEPVWRTILKVADETDAQLIVVGARGRSAIESLLLGSVSTALVHHSARATLIVPLTPAEAKGEAD
jgi:nucleotide-binding universal stress UspA family protein